MRRRLKTRPNRRGQVDLIGGATGLRGFDQSHPARLFDAVDGYGGVAIVVSTRPTA